MTHKEIHKAIVSSQCGEQWAYRSLFSEFNGMVWRMVRQMVDNDMEAEELTQDVFVKAFGALASFDENKAHFATWLGRIAYNTVINHLKTHRTPTLSLTNCDIEDDSEDTAYDTDQTPNLLEERINELTHQMQEMPGEDRTLLTMYYFERLPLKDIAYMMQTKPEILANRLARIRKRLYKRLKEKGL